MVILIILLIVAVGVLILTIIKLVNQAKFRKNAIAHYNKLLNTFYADKYFAQPDGLCLIALNHSEREFLISYSGVDKILKYTDIVCSEIIIDGQMISSKSASASLAGGLLFGTTGAVVGSNMGVTKYKKNIKTVILKLLVNDVFNPAYELIFFEAPQSKDAKQAQQDCQSWQDTIIVATAQLVP